MSKSKNVLKNANNKFVTTILENDRNKTKQSNIPNKTKQSLILLKYKSDCKIIRHFPSQLKSLKRNIKISKITLCSCAVSFVGLHNL